MLLRRGRRCSGGLRRALTYSPPPPRTGDKRTGGKHPPPRVRHLIYHVCALEGNEGWRANLRQLRRRQEVFNGRRVVAIARGPGLLAPEVVREELPEGCEILELPNCPVLREVATFLPLLLSVETQDPESAVFYAHTKGNSTAGNRRGATYWRNAMYAALLDAQHPVGVPGERRLGWAECMEALRECPAVGCHKMVWPVGAPAPYPSGLSHGRWMFAGTFFWFRGDAVFGDPRWRRIPMDRYGAEAWLAGLFGPEEVRSVYQLWPETQYPTPSPYDPALYPEPIEDEES
jgi:hypothetical protein